MSAGKLASGRQSEGLQVDEIGSVEQMIYGVDEAVNILNQSFNAMFIDAENGWAAMADAAVRAIQQIAAEIAARAALFAILKLAGVNVDFSTFVLGGVSSMPSGKTKTVDTTSGGGGTGGDSGGGMTQELVAQLQPQHIDIIMRRYYNT